MNMKQGSKNDDYDPQTELFSMLDMDSIKDNSKTNKKSASSPENKISRKLNQEEELVSDTFHEQMVYDDMDFSDKDVVDHEFENCIFKHCNFQKADLSACIFRDCIFENCTLVLTNIINVVISNTRFKTSKLMGLNFSECCNHGFFPIFDDCLIKSCAFEGNNMKHVAFFECKVHDTDFSYCDMTDSKFDRTDLENTSFHDNQMYQADFTDAYGYTIDPFSNKIKGAKFSLPAANSFLNYLGITIE